MSWFCNTPRVWLRMIEWVIALLVGLGSFSVVYASAFTLTMIASKRTAFGEKMKGRSWLSNAIVGPVVLIGSFSIMTLLSQGQLSSWGVQCPTLGEVLIVALSGSVLAAVTCLTAEAVSPTPDEMAPPKDTHGRVGFFLLIVVLASISEELIFRGVLQNLLDRSYLISLDFGLFSLTSGAFVSGLLFALVHAAPARRMGISPAALVGSALVLGVAAGIALHETGSLVAPILVHGLFNFFGFALGIGGKGEQSSF